MNIALAASAVDTTSTSYAIGHAVGTLALITLVVVVIVRFARRRRG